MLSRYLTSNLISIFLVCEIGLEPILSRAIPTQVFFIKLLALTLNLRMARNGRKITFVGFLKVIPYLQFSSASYYVTIIIIIIYASCGLLLHSNAPQLIVYKISGSYRSQALTDNEYNYMYAILEFHSE